MTAMVRPKGAQTEPDESKIIKSEKGTARVNKEGVLEIEEQFEDEVPRTVQKKKRETKGIEFVGDPFSRVNSPADLAKISIKMQEN